MRVVVLRGVFDCLWDSGLVEEREVEKGYVNC